MQLWFKRVKGIFVAHNFWREVVQTLDRLFSFRVLSDGLRTCYQMECTLKGCVFCYVCICLCKCLCQNRSGQKLPSNERNLLQLFYQFVSSATNVATLHKAFVQYLYPNLTSPLVSFHIVPLIPNSSVLFKYALYYLVL